MSLRLRKPAWHLRHLLWLGILTLFVWGLQTIPLQAIWQAIQGLSLQAVTTLILVNIGLFLLFSSRWWLFCTSRVIRYPTWPWLAIVWRASACHTLRPGHSLAGNPSRFIIREHHNLPEGARWRP